MAWAEVKFAGQATGRGDVTAVATVDGQPRRPLAAASTRANDRADGRVALLRPAEGHAAGRRAADGHRSTPPMREESVAERVPVAGRDMIVEFFPEGGKLVAGVPNRVYVRATTPTGRPSTSAATVTDGDERRGEGRGAPPTERAGREPRARLVHLHPEGRRGLPIQARGRARTGRRSTCRRPRPTAWR